MADRYRNWWTLSAVNVVTVLLLVICAQTTAGPTTRGQFLISFCYSPMFYAYRYSISSTHHIMWANYIHVYMPGCLFAISFSVGLCLSNIMKIGWQWTTLWQKISGLLFWPTL